ncbi:transcription factor IIA subunit alpha [Cadophora gregata]|uniref:transcription factor IIA subunit alpha n=1 Tax=Cadophora gregata TaxID=51156 RepID=UPI0026DCA642|nr:transcription factor IIA subunit alpha [Cadophora gregata]KAK0124105.1 transcription factor IIA subunit alpha [Cadophora gregata]KAK0130438.1 transcription factor IIA subunit alpha [Cadophora gregata f. sp. sojae]
MSNTQVGNVYSQIITDVIDSSRVDFEEGGVDEHVLDELRMGWQQKLSQLQVAQFPWDPKPEPVPAMSNPPTVPSNAGNYQSNTPPIPQNQGQGLTLPQVNNGNRQPQIKSEPGLDHGMQQPPQQPYTAMPLTLPANATQAQQRAAQHLHQNYGPRAAASISAIQVPGAPPNNQNQQMMGQQQAQQQQRNIQQNGPPQGMSMQQHQQQLMANQNQNMQRLQGMQQQGARPPMSQEQYRQVMAQNAANRLQQANGQNGVGGAQTDGAGDEVESFGVIKSVNSSGEEVMGRIEIDSLIRSKIESMGTSMEGGGLMLPLHQASTAAKRQRKVKKSAAMQQTDGPEDDDDKDDVKDEELDEDAINSDLDDPDDGLNDEEDDDESMGHIMLCMYDKVQRVKNKWYVLPLRLIFVNGPPLIHQIGSAS